MQRQETRRCGLQAIPIDTRGNILLQAVTEPSRIREGIAGVTLCIREESAYRNELDFPTLTNARHQPPIRLSADTMSNSRERSKRNILVPKSEGNPEGKGADAFLADWQATTPRGVVAKSERQVLAELFTSMLVLSAAFKYQPVPGASNYLYWTDGQWSLSLIAPWEWSAKRRAAFVGTCVLQRDMTWTIDPSDRLLEDNPAAGAIRRFFQGFVRMLDTDLTLEEILPTYVVRLPYYQRLHASAMSRSLHASVARGDQASTRCREWRNHLPRRENELLAFCS
jgi:hypothetical protein